MVAIKNLLFLATAISALTIGKRDTATILNDIAAINTNVQAVTTATNNYNGGILAAIPIVTAEGNLEAAIDQGTTDAQATPQGTSADSQSVIAAIDTLIPNIEASLTAIIAKKTQFAADGLTSTVYTTLGNLKVKTDAFSDALIAIASADTKDAGIAQKARIDSDFDAAIAAFAA
ncbi:hydrophobic surface binding protein A-domain-containing protein [Leptodontidium sp. 2 PMI_412]|nr:hydrophobic surface binding protein A-domain-containing protein [Leptodontidium sp. MPI-SDFR-AT-0119]KAH9223536.1 hydrophobic surface binding protein A-domain-containing protein [Leptodontidium sp. 2 PMI_412]